MEKFEKITGLVAPMDRANVDTDAIIPKQFLKSIKRSGFGPNLFDEWRYLDHGEPGKDNSGRPLNPDFVLNQPRYQGASVLLGRENFGCGSSREHAPWALLDYGFRVVIAPSFADIFYNNCFKNSILPIIVSKQELDDLMTEIAGNEGVEFEIDLENQQISTAAGTVINFEIDAFRKENLLKGLDDIGLTMQNIDKISAFEQRQKQAMPWLWT